MDGPALTNIDRGAIADEPLWLEVKRVTRPIVVDIAVFVLILVALLMGFVGLHALKSAGYDGDRVHTFEALHYWCYAGVYTLFGVDLLFKITLALFFRNSVEKKARPND